MATLKITLDQRRAKKDLTYPLVLRVRYLSKYFDISTNISCTAKEFDSKRSILLNKPELNIQLQELKNFHTIRLTEFLKENFDKKYEISDIKAYLLNTCKKQDFNFETFWQSEIEILLNSKRTGSAKTYTTALNVFKSIIDLKIPVNEFQYRDLVLIETSLIKRGVSINSIAVYMRTFRAICNKAILNKQATSEWYPFRKYKIKKEKTTPKVLSKIELIRFFNLSIKEDSPLYLTWCIGKLIFMLRGINLTDLLQLNERNIQQERIIYKRDKTGKLYSIFIEPQIRETLEIFFTLTNEKFIEKDFLSKSTLKDLNKYIDLRKKVNSQLKKLGTLSEITTPLSTYVFRYSYANLAKSLGYSKDLIAEALGHEYGNSVTGIYLELFDNDIVDKMNSELIKTVANKRVEN